MKGRQKKNIITNFRSPEMCGISSVKYCIKNASISWHDLLARIGDSYSSYFVRCFYLFIFSSVFFFLRSYVKYLECPRHWNPKQHTYIQQSEQSGEPNHSFSVFFWLFSFREKELKIRSRVSEVKERACKLHDVMYYNL